MTASATFCNVALFTALDWNRDLSVLSLDWVFASGIRTHQGVASGVLALPCVDGGVFSVSTNLPLASYLPSDVALGRDWLQYCRQAVPNACFRLSSGLVDLRRAPTAYPIPIQSNSINSHVIAHSSSSVSKPIRFVPWAAPPTEGGGVPRRGRPSATILTPQHKAAPTNRATRTPKDADLRFLARDILRALGKAHLSTTDDEPPHVNQRVHALAALPSNGLSTPSVSIVISAPPSSSVAWPSQGVPLLLPAGSSLTVRVPGPIHVDRPPPRSFYVLVPPAPPYVKAAALKRALRLDTRPPAEVGPSGFKEPGRQYKCKKCKKWGHNTRTCVDG
ncbi:hypothetical protein B0H13DRAFT_2003276 [Mycena leptocephala]|nr:hypothetical protein B0H13DRAFT_2003276 [Mycena leptocephala]